MKALDTFGKIYTFVMVVSSLIPIYFTFQFFMEVPNLRPYILWTLIVPIIGIGTGLYGLRVTKDEEEEGEAVT